MICPIMSRLWETVDNDTHTAKLRLESVECAKSHCAWWIQEMKKKPDGPDLTESGCCAVTIINNQ